MIKIVEINKLHCRGYDTRGDRNRAVAQLIRNGHNYFVFYRDTQADFALQYSVADWVKPGTHYLNP